MNVLHAERVMSEDDALALWRSDTTAIGHSANVRLRPEDGDAVTVMVDGVPEVVICRFPLAELAPLRRALVGLPTSEVRRTAGIRTDSTGFGYVARLGAFQRNTCRVAALSQTHGPQHATICAAAATLAELLEHHHPAQYRANLAAVASVGPDWLLPGLLWTSGVINRTTQFPYHRDRNNFDAWSAMPVVRRHVRGGHLHFPELAVDGQPLVAACGDGDVLLFNGQRWMHGVTPMKKLSKDAYRISAVYYPVRNMAQCLPPDEELAQAGIRRTETEATLLDRQRAAGLLNY